MKRTSFSQLPCSIARTMDVLGDGWTALLLREAFYGVCRFEDFQTMLNMPRNTLTDRLKRLVDEGLLKKRIYEEKPARYEYILTRKGADFFPVLAAMASWGDRWLAGRDGPPIIFHHKVCDHDMQAAVTCGQCGEPLRLLDIGARPGDAYPPRRAVDK